MDRNRWSGKSQTARFVEKGVATGYKQKIEAIVFIQRNDFDCGWLPVSSLLIQM